MNSQIINYITELIKSFVPDKIAFIVYTAFYILLFLLFNFFSKNLKEIKKEKNIKKSLKLESYIKAFTAINLFLSNQTSDNKYNLINIFQEVLQYSDVKLSKLIISFINNLNCDNSMELNIINSSLQKEINSEINKRKITHNILNLDYISNKIDILNIDIIAYSILLSFVSILIILPVIIIFVGNYENNYTTFENTLSLVSYIFLTMLCFFTISLYGDYYSFEEKLLSLSNLKIIFKYIISFIIYFLVLKTSNFYHDVIMNILANIIGCIIFTFIIKKIIKSQKHEH